MPLHRSGKMRGLGIRSTERMAMAPDIPIICENGVLGMDVVGRSGVVVPIGVPKEVTSSQRYDTDR
jgi:tripartite-type tricarboxylate transporter receptor subunit TctC